MSSEDDLIKHYNRFLDLADPLLDSRKLDDEECDVLFWYGFHPEDRAMLLHRLPKRRNRRTFPSGRYFTQRAKSFLKSQKTSSESFGTLWNSTRYPEGHAMTGVTPRAGLHSLKTGREKSCKNSKTRRRRPRSRKADTCVV